MGLYMPGELRQRLATGLYSHEVTWNRMKVDFNMRIRRADLWLDPMCCKEGQQWLESQPNMVLAAENCFNPAFCCWFLDYFHDHGFKIALEDRHFSQRFWRITLYEFFLKEELAWPGPLVRILLWIAKKNVRTATLLFWLSNGWFESHRRPTRIPVWWLSCSSEIKELYQGVRGFLSEVD